MVVVVQMCIVRIGEAEKGTPIRAVEHRHALAVWAWTSVWT